MVALLVSIMATFGAFGRKNFWTQAVHLAVRLACVQALEKEGKGVLGATETRGPEGAKREGRKRLTGDYCISRF